MDINWSIVAGAAGFAAGRALLDEYRIWKARRITVSLDWNPRTQAYEPDLRLKRWERVGRIAAWGAYGAICVIGYNVIANGWLAGY